MQELFTKRRLVIGTIVVLFVLSLNLFSSEARGLFSSMSVPSQTILWDVGDKISTFFGGGTLKKRVESLESKNFGLRAQLIELQDIKSENEDLRQALKLDVDKDFLVVMGDIIGKSISEDTIILRVGREKGVEKGMPVITPGRVVVGRVIEVFGQSSKVQLISNKKSSSDAKVSEKEITGIIRGEGGQKLLLDLVPQEDDLTMGDIIITSSLGGIFPENLLIGEIVEIVKTGADPFQKARVNPYFDLRSIDTVFIITALNEA